MRTKKARSSGLASLIRTAFVKSGITRFELAKRAGISYSMTHRFITGERSVTLETADRMLDGLGLEAKLIRRKGR